MPILSSRFFFAILLASFFFGCTPAYVPSHQYAYPDIRLKLQSNLGQRASTIIFDPERQQYITFWVGNREFDAEVFDINGKPIYAGAAHVDTRGIWLGKKGKRIETNAYLSGVEAIALDDKGFPTGKHTIINHLHEPPTADAAATLDTDSRQLIYLVSPGAWVYTMRGKAKKPIRFKGLPVAWKAINQNQVLYTGWRGKELGLVDFVSKKVYLFDKQTGMFSASISLHPKIVVPKHFGIGFANGLLWLFDEQKREWIGYNLDIKPYGKKH